MPDAHSKTSDPAVGSNRLLACAECGTFPIVETMKSGDLTCFCPKCRAEEVVATSKYALRECWNFKQESKQANTELRHGGRP